MNDLPEIVQDSFARMAESLLSELQGSELRVVLVDAPEQRHCGHKVRMAVDKNAHWWSQLYANHQPRKLDKGCFSNALQRIVDGRTNRQATGPYDPMAFELCREYLTDIYPDDCVIVYFKTGVPF